MDTPKRYHPVHVMILHWLIVLGVFLNLYLGIFIFSQRGRGSFQSQTIHMAVGFAILVLGVVFTTQNGELQWAGSISANPVGRHLYSGCTVPSIHPQG